MLGTLDELKASTKRENSLSPLTPNRIRDIYLPKQNSIDSLLKDLPFSLTYIIITIAEKTIVFTIKKIMDSTMFLLSTTVYEPVGSDQRVSRLPLRALNPNDLMETICSKLEFEGDAPKVEIYE